MAARTSGSTLWPMSRSHLLGHEHRHHHQQHADDDAAQGVEQGIAGGHGEQHGDEGEGQTEQGGEILAEDHDQLALAAVAEPAPQRLRAAAPCSPAQAAPHGEAFGDDAEAEHADRQPRPLQRLGMLQLVQALVHGKHATDGKQQQCHEEGPGSRWPCVAQGKSGEGGRLARFRPSSSRP